MCKHKLNQLLHLVTLMTDIACDEFKDIVDKHLSVMTVTEYEIKEVERQTRGQHNNQLWRIKRKFLLTVSSFGNAAKTTLEPSIKNLNRCYIQILLQKDYCMRERMKQ